VYVNVSVSRLSIPDWPISSVFFSVYVNVSVSRLSIPDCHICNVLFLCMSMSVSHSTIMNGQSKESDIDIHKKKTLEMGQSGMDNLETLTLT
jgi:hypothetical protein